MLGDWVMLNPDLKEYYPFAGKPCMVIGLHDDDGAIKIEYDNGKYFWTDAEDDVIPIPLTPEMLDSNGFTNTGDGTYTKMFNGEHYLIYVGFKYHTIDALMSFGNTKSNEVRLNNCGMYLHELQHVLRLCGIEKEIVP
jgi:hypothetical protein